MELATLARVPAPTPAVVSAAMQMATPVEKGSGKADGGKGNDSSNPGNSNNGDGSNGCPGRWKQLWQGQVAPQAALVVLRRDNISFVS
ncbi:hypothetical protein [Microvirga ossetica]|uniref:hypothetical protein n=1 Tax=Microvirga ossetica TaxID=1882682 RepID=UPI00139060CA|nr:hypothetical protein [Microvirga ossetica]